MYRIKNWTKFQHYKGRRLLWIKLHIALLSDVDYLALTEKGKLTLIHCWMVGGEVWDQEKEVEPLLTSNQKLLKSLLKLDGNLRVNELKRAGYLILVPNDYNNLKSIPASENLAGCLQVDVDLDVDVDKPSNTNNSGKGGAVRFTKPTLEEVSLFCQQRGSNIDPEYFYHYQEARDWIFNNGRKMKCWKSTVRTWEKNPINRNQSQGKTVRTYEDEQ